MWLHWLHSYTLRRAHKTNVLAVRRCNEWCNHTVVCMVTDGGWTVASEKQWYKRRGWRTIGAILFSPTQIVSSSLFIISSRGLVGI